MTRDVRDGIAPSSRPIFPLATIDDLLDELADTDRAIDRLGEAFIVNQEQRAARRDRLQWWRDRIVAQLEQMRQAV